MQLVEKRITKLTEFNSYIKIEKNGIPYSTKNYTNSTSILHKITLVQEEEENSKKIQRKIQIKNNQNEILISFDVGKINRIVDKLINEGKITIILLNSTKENFVVFISNSTKEILLNFLKYLKFKISSSGGILFEFNLAEGDYLNRNKNDNLKKGKSEISDTKKEINDNIRFGKKRKYQELYKIKEEEKKNIVDYLPRNNVSTNNINLNKNNLNSNINNKKESFKAILHSNTSKQISKICEINERKPNLIAKNINKNENKIQFTDLPQSFLIDIFLFLDKESSNNFCLCNKFLKKIHDSFKEKLELRSETPAIQIKNLLSRYENLTNLKIGKGKKIKNEIFKNFSSNLKTLKKLNLAYIDSLNESSLLKILSKTSIQKLNEIKISFDLPCLNNILNHLLIFTEDLESLCVDSQKKDHYSNEEKNYYQRNEGFCVENKEEFVELLTTKKPNSIQYHQILSNILLKKKKIFKFNCFLINFNIIKTNTKQSSFENVEKNNNDSNNQTNINPNNNSTHTNFPLNNSFSPTNSEINLFQNLQILKIEFLIIKNLSDLQILENAGNLIHLSISNILLIKKINISNDNKNSMTNFNFPKQSNKIQLSRLNLKNFKMENIQEIENELEQNFNYLNFKTIQTEEKSENFTVRDFEFQEDYLEIFIKIFSKMRNLKVLKFGHFLNSELLKIISAFCKKIEIIKINSNEISDEDFISFMEKETFLKEIDLRGSEQIYGNCFTEIKEIPKFLKKVKLSLTSFNFYKVIEYLKNCGINAKNFI